MAAANVGKKRRADEAQFRYAAMKFFDRCADVLLSKCSRAFDPLWIFRAIFGKPGIARGRKGGGEAGILQCRERSRKTGAEENGDIDSFAVHIYQPSFGIGDARGARMWPAVGAADAMPRPLGRGQALPSMIVRS